MREEEGRHTTTASRRYPLESGGTLIDSPGVRDFAPAIEQLDAKTLGFPEVDGSRRALPFQDCRHMQEPACAVIAAVETGALSARRYESYAGCAGATRISSKRAVRQKRQALDSTPATTLGSVPNGMCSCMLTLPRPGRGGAIRQPPAREETE